MPHVPRPHPVLCPLESFRRGHVLFVSYTQTIKKERGRTESVRPVPPPPHPDPHITQVTHLRWDVSEECHQEGIRSGEQGASSTNLFKKKKINTVFKKSKEGNSSSKGCPIMYPRPPASEWQDELETKASDFRFLASGPCPPYPHSPPPSCPGARGVEENPDRLSPRRSKGACFL